METFTKTLLIFTICFSTFFSIEVQGFKDPTISFKTTKQKRF